MQINLIANDYVTYIKCVFRKRSMTLANHFLDRHSKGIYGFFQYLNARSSKCKILRKVNQRMTGHHGWIKAVSNERTSMLNGYIHYSQRCIEGFQRSLIAFTIYKLKLSIRSNNQKTQTLKRSIRFYCFIHLCNIFGYIIFSVYQSALLESLLLNHYLCKNFKVVGLWGWDIWLQLIRGSES